MLQSKKRTRITIAILAALLAAGVFLFMFIYLAISQRKHIYKTSQEISKVILQQTATETQMHFSSAFVIANSLQQRVLLLKEMNAARDNVEKLIKNILVDNSPLILGAWVLFEPNAFDGKDSLFANKKEFPCKGRFSLSFFRDNGELYSEAVPCSNYNAFFYAEAKEKCSPVLSEPYLFRYTGYSNVYFGCTISVPIMQDSTFLGVAGIDIDIKYLQENISQIRLFESGFICLSSPNGILVSHPDTASIRKNIWSFTNPSDSLAVVKAFKGYEVAIGTYSGYLNEKVFRFYYPINLFLSEKPWLVISEIPISKASTRSQQVIWVATIIFVIGLLLISYLIGNIIVRRNYERKIEAALHEAETHRLKADESYRNYLEIFNSTSEAIFIHNAETGIIIDINETMLKMYRLSSKSEAVGKHVNIFSSGIEPFNHDGAQKRIKEALEKGATVFEWHSKRADGTTFWSEVSLRATKISGLKCVLAVVRDIEDRKIAQQALEVSEQKFRQLAEFLPLVVWEVDLNGRFTYTNKVGFKLFGYTPDDMAQGVNIMQMIAPSDRERLAENIKKILANGQNTDDEYLALRKDGSTFPVINYSSVVYHSSKTIGLRGILIDITEKKQAEEKIRESEQLYRTVVESLNEALMLMDNDDRILFVNNRFTELLGYSPHEVIGKISYELLIPGEKQQEIIKANTRRKQGHKEVYEMPFIAKDGRIISFMVSGAPAYNAQGEVVGSIGAMVDITSLKKAEQNYRYTQKLFETLAHMSPVGIYRTDAMGKTTYVNPQWCELTGLTPNEAMGNEWVKAVHPDDREKIIDGWYERVGKQEKFYAEYRFLRKDGSVVWVLGNTLPEEKDGKVSGYIGTITDITQLKIAQEKLANSEKRFRDLTDLLPQSIWEIDLSGKVIFINKFGLENMGYSWEDYKKGVNIFGSIVPEYRDMAIENVKKRFAGKLTGGIEYIAQRKNGEQFPVLVYSSPIIENGVVTGLRGISIDITDIKKAQEELERYQNHLEILVKERTEELEAVNEELSAANEELYSQREKLIAALNDLKNAQQSLVQSEKMASLGLLAAGVAHEINNPLNFIQGGITAIESFINENFLIHSRELQPLIEAIKEGVKRSAQIVRSLNQYSRTDYTKHTDVHVHQIIENCLVLLGNHYRDRIEIKRHYCECSDTIYCNEGQIHQAFMNILVNAIQAIAGEGTITISTEVHNNNHITVIEDTGCGIEPDSLKRIFDPFFTTKEPGVGTGLGLSITFNIIRDHKGTINIESEPGKGTRVTVTLPQSI